jgi:membrane protease subunit (stomatin/prohibitin family)
MFKKRIKVFHSTFSYFCEKLGSYLRKQHISIINPTSMEDRVAMSLIWLGSGNGLQLVGDLFGVTKGTILVIVKEFCHMIRLHLRKLFM